MVNTLMVGSLYRALIAAKVPEEQARAAAADVAADHNRLSRLKADLTRLKGMVGFNIALTLAGFGIVLRAISGLAP